MKKHRSIRWHQYDVYGITLPIGMALYHTMVANVNVKNSRPIYCASSCARRIESFVSGGNEISILRRGDPGDNGYTARVDRRCWWSAKSVHVTCRSFRPTLRQRRCVFLRKNGFILFSSIGYKYPCMHWGNFLIQYSHWQRFGHRVVLWKAWYCIFIVLPLPIIVCALKSLSIVKKVSTHWFLY